MSEGNFESIEQNDELEIKSISDFENMGIKNCIVIKEKEVDVKKVIEAAIGNEAFFKPTNEEEGNEYAVILPEEEVPELLSENDIYQRLTQLQDKIAA